MASSSSRFAEGMRRVINGGSSSTPATLEEFPPLHGGSSSAPRARVSPVKEGADSQSRVPVDLRGPSRASPHGTEVGADTQAKGSVGSRGPPRVSPPGTETHNSGAGSAGSGHSDGHIGGLKETVPGGDADASGISWSSLFSTEVKLEFVAHMIKDGKKSFLISKSVLDKGVSLWDDCLVGQFFGLPPN